MAPSLISVPIMIIQVCCLELQCWVRREGFEGKVSTGSLSWGRHLGVTAMAGKCWWEAVSTQDGLLEETVLYLVPQEYPLCALKHRKDAPTSS